MQRLEQLLRLDRYPDRYERSQAIVAYIVIFGAILATGGATFLDPTFSFEHTWDIFGIGVEILLVALLFLLRAGRLRLARYALLALALVAGLGYFWLIGGTSETGILIGVLLLIISALLVTNPLFVLVITALVNVKEVAAYLTLPEMMPLGRMLTLVSFELFFGLLLFMLARGWRQGLRIAEIETAERRSRLSDLTTEVMQTVFKRLDLETLLAETVNLVRDRFPEIYHAQIFLVDESNQNAVLKASTGEAGQKLLARGHQLGVGSQSVIGQVALLAEPLVALSGEGSVHHRNELLPNTQTELALPMISGDRVLGALDVQSERPNAFSEDDIAILQALANQIAIAIDNATLFLEQQVVIEENQQLIAQAQAQVTQIQDLNRRLTRMAWDQYLGQHEGISALTIDYSTDTLTPEAEWTPGMQAAIDVSENTLPPAASRSLAVPLTVRGQPVGALEFELEQEGGLEAEQLNLVQEVAARLSLSMESHRLFEEAQRLARREAIINELGGRLQSVTGMENVLFAAARGLQEALQAPHVAIRLGAPPEEAPNGAAHAAEEESA
ncbi:MAG: GAF domain-containing protein [Anaerolineae bacterium]|nr:GAF domain-containing protein [Anaerolineae bacterium]